MMNLSQFNRPHPMRFNYPKMDILNRRGLSPFASGYRSMNPYGGSNIYQSPYAQASPYMLAQNAPNRIGGMINMPQDVEDVEDVKSAVAATTAGVGFNWPQSMSNMYGRMMTNPYDFQSRISPGFNTGASRYV